VRLELTNTGQTKEDHWNTKQRMSTHKDVTCQIKKSLAPL